MGYGIITQFLNTFTFQFAIVKMIGEISMGVILYIFSYETKTNI